MESISKKITQKITERKLSPKPRWVFRLRELLLWCGIVFGVVVSAVSMGMIIDFFIQEEVFSVWQARKHVIVFITAIPYVWCVVVCGITFLVHTEFKRTKNGYKTAWYWVLCAVVGFSIVLGFTSSFLQISQRVEQVLTRAFPVLQHSTQRAQQYWSQPDAGLISGTIISVNADSMVLSDWDQKQWTILITGETTIRSRATLTPQSQVKIIGNRTSDHSFTATEIRPWMPGMNKMNGGMGRFQRMQ
ncbi:MAG TPA: DUF5666 domain-containing protein [Patescibacteria group bacterium]|nr:DUF5666 domain-containing protein [Patescibacteria group bacterium]